MYTQRLGTSTAPEGFVPLPRPFFDILLCDQDALGLGLRDVLLLLLIARLTHGCRDVVWASLAPTHLAAVGIGRGHARECLDRLLGSGLVERNGDRDEYRLRSALPEGTASDGARKAVLGALVGRHLILTRQRRPVERDPVPLPPASSTPVAETFPEYPQMAASLPAPVSPLPVAAPLVNYAHPGVYASTAGRRWRFDREAKRFVRDPDPSPSIPIALSDLRQAAVDVFAFRVDLPQQMPPVKEKMR